MDWSAEQYRRYEAERTQPARDLLSRVPLTLPGLAVDLGCGPGNSTEVLMERFSSARAFGVDSSPDMIASAKARLPGTRFELADISRWDDPGPFDLILANAVLQWVPDHETLFPRLMTRLAPGGCLAVQMPDNLDEPSHRLMREVAAEGPWAGKLAKAAEARVPRHDAGWYYALLRNRASHCEVWRTTYFHPLRGAAGVVDWVRSTGLRPFLAPLEPDEQTAFLARYQAGIESSYPALPDGTVLLPFPRLFVIAVR